MAIEGISVLSQGFLEPYIVKVAGESGPFFAFAAMIAVAASASVITPLAPACLLIYGAGRYKFADFLRVGGLLTILIYLVAIILVPQVWPL